jgi:hypothetical protein
MSELFACGDTSALVSYVYDECELEVRAAIAAHLDRCVSCSREIEGLGWTRQQLGVWTPPVAELGFQMPVSALERRLPWWRAPLPAWAQVAAAVLLFSAGLTVGMARGAGTDTPAASSQPVATSVVNTVSPDDLAHVEQRLKAEMAQLRPASPAVTVAPSSDEAIMRKVQALVEQSEERQRREFTIRSVELARDIEAQRRVDLASVRETLGTLQGVTGAEMRQQREAIDRINNFFRVSQPGR